MVNLLVELDERFDEAARSQAFRTLENAGLRVEDRHGADDRTLAWIDDVFGGAWSGEANAGSNVVAFKDGSPAGFATYDPVGLSFAWLRGVASESDTAIFGPFGVDPAHRGSSVGSALLTAALCGLRRRDAKRACIAAVGDQKLIEYYVRNANARIAERFDPAAFTPRPVRTVVLASGNGTNFQAVLDRVESGALPLDVRALVSNKENAYAIERARSASVPHVHVLPWQREEVSRAEYDAKLLQIVAEEEPELVLLLGWMHLLDTSFVTAFPELINVHPSFLPLDSSRDTVGMPDGTTIPAFRGAHAVRDAMQAACGWVGASVHVVTPATDRGPVLVRKPLRVLPGEDEAAVLERLHPIEHQLVERGIRRWLYER